MNDTIYRQAAIDALHDEIVRRRIDENTNDDGALDEFDTEEILRQLPLAQPDIKQAAKLLSDFIESCPGGDSYLITPDGEELRTDWGYATEGVQLIYDWAERRNDG